MALLRKFIGGGIWIFEFPGRIGIQVGFHREFACLFQPGFRDGSGLTIFRFEILYICTV